MHQTLPDDLLGEIVVAGTVLVEDAVFDEAALYAQIKQRLARYNIPRAFLQFEDADFALTGNERIKSADLPLLAAARLEAKT
jgi:hypothetical protein